MKMKKMLTMLCVSVFLTLSFTGGVFADTLDLTGWKDITINDNDKEFGGGSHGYDGVIDTRVNNDRRTDTEATVGEDMETEPGTIGAQAWDLEGMFYNETSGQLALVGGYDFRDGYGGLDSGDVFFATSTTLENPATGFNGDDYQYDYVMDLDYAASAYNVYYIGDIDLDLGGPYDPDDVHTQDVVESINVQSNPWRYKENGMFLGTGSLQYYDFASDTYVGTDFDGSLRYGLVVDTSDIGNQDFFYAHYTYQCGNDNLMAYTDLSGGAPAPTPEPATMLLLGLGLIGFAGLARRKTNR